MQAKQPVILEGYFSDEDVATMLHYPTKIQKPAHLPNMEGAFGFETSLEADQMSMDRPIAGLTGDEDDDKSILKVTEAILSVKAEMEKFFGLELSMTNCNYAAMLPGGFNPMHSDDSQLDGTPYHENEETEYSALIYLNESGVDYEGGDILFPLQETVIAPKRGMVVFFKGDYHHPHEVTVVTSGERKALVLFFGRKGNVSSRPLFSDEYSGVPLPATE
jgi:Rps23 Pro-64 3,4-dihydroxylase Tpa1-like proline 4-hydroxylase